MSERNNVLILLALFAIMGLAATAMQIFQGSDVNEITVSLNNTGNLDTPVQSITYISQSRADIKSMLDTHIVSGYSDPRYLVNGDYFSNQREIIFSHDGILSGYTTKLTIPWRSSMAADFADFRFTTPSSTSIPYWIESKTDSVSVDVWPNNDYSDGDTSILLHYGNSGLSSTSSITDTMLAGSEFDDLTGWTQQSGTWTTGSTLTSTADAFLRHTAPLSVSSDFIIEMRAKSGDNFYPGIVAKGDATLSNTVGYSMYGYTYSAISPRFRIDGVNNDGSTMLSDFTWYRSKAKLHLTSGNNVFEIYTDDGTLIDSSESATDSVNTDDYFGIYAVSDADMEIDWLFARICIPVEPTYVIGPERQSITVITPNKITLNSIINSTGTYGSYPIIPANTEQDFTLNGTQNFNYTIDFTPTDLTVTTSSSVLYADRSHVFNAVVKDHNTGAVMPTQPDKVKYRLIGSGNTSVSAKEFVGTSLTLPALQKGTYTLFTSVGWDNIPSWSNEISQTVQLTDAATPAQVVALSVVDALTETTTDTTSNETTEDVLVGVPGRIADGWKTMIDDIITFIKNIIHNVSAVFS